MSLLRTSVQAQIDAGRVLLAAFPLGPCAEDVDVHGEFKLRKGIVELWNCGTMIYHDDL